MMRHHRIVLTRPVRLGISLFWIILFFIISPIIILYTAGYRYDISEKKIKQTGVISIDIKPKNVDVFINKVALETDIPIRLTNRAPGDYTITLEKDGYHSWQSVLAVESNQTTYIRNITLLRKSLPYVLFDDPSYTVHRVYTTPQQSKILLSSGSKGIFELYLYDHIKKTSSLLLRQAYASEPTISWSPNGNLFSVDMTDLGGKLYVFDTEEHRFSISDPIWSGTMWHKTYGLIARENDTLFAMTPTGGKRSLSYTPTSSVWYVSNTNTVWEYDETSSRFIEYQFDGSIQSSIEIPTKSSVIRIIDANATMILFETSQGITQYTFSDSSPIIFSGATHAEMNPYTEEWIISSEHEVWSVTLNGLTTLLERSSDMILSVMPLDEYGLLAIAKKTGIDAYDPLYGVRQPLFTNGEFDHIGVSMKERTLFFRGIIANKDTVFALEY